ncbi:MAG: SH3 domain-containing protein [Bacteroidota bacterium]
MAALKIKKEKREMHFAKKALATILLIIFYMQMWASNGPGFIEGTQLYVVANSGLTLRVAPDVNSESLGVVDYGSSVEVLNQPDSIEHIQRVNWVEGRWIYVDYDGITGYMFDGYLSDLPLPIYEFEKCQLDLDLIYPLESWVEINLGESQVDTVEAGVLHKITDRYIGGEKMVRSSKNEEYKLELYMNEIRLMDAYHLLQSMIDSKARLQSFKDQSTFIENRDGELYKVKINLDNPIVIRKLKSGDVKISIWADNYVCGL